MTTRRTLGTGIEAPAQNIRERRPKTAWRSVGYCWRRSVRQEGQCRPSSGGANSRS
ncbi:hypothetical protein ACFWA5_50260 [Streptomyces mirabilis]|uniref:hypothetical protein n=1 Tax=Streptomyces mirabilis TaxID=68239 RepID=UPI0036578EE4